eukprot:1157681-Pelagomonas_calceolata.AAC.6
MCLIRSLASWQSQQYHGAPRITESLPTLTLQLRTWASCLTVEGGQKCTLTINSYEQGHGHYSRTHHKIQTTMQLDNCLGIPKNAAF